MATTKRSRSVAKRGRKRATKRATKRTTTPKKAATKRAAKKRSSRTKSPLKDPAGGLTAAGRKAFARSEGAHLKPGVRGAADTPEKMRRKGSFLRRHFATLRGPLVDDDGKPTRLALQAHAWGEPVPRTAAAAKRLAEKGTRLLERYRRSKEATKRATTTKRANTTKRGKTAKKTTKRSTSS